MWPQRYPLPIAEALFIHRFTFQLTIFLKQSLTGHMT
jgi:hypothetical protein